MDRRTVLKAGFTLALTAHTPLASGELREIPSVSEIGTLIVRFHAAVQELEDAERAIIVCEDFPGLVDHPHVSMTEVHPAVWIAGLQRHPCCSEASINEVFDTVDRHIRRQDEWLSRQCADKLIPRNEDARQAALGLFRDRAAARDEWERRSGYGEAEKAFVEVCGRTVEIEDAIKAYHPKTLGEVHEKTAFAVKHWGANSPKQVLYELLASFAPET